MIPLLVARWKMNDVNISLDYIYIIFQVEIYLVSLSNRSAITNNMAIMKPRDMTRDQVTTNEPPGSQNVGKYHEGYYYQPLALAEVAEIETVL